MNYRKRACAVVFRDDKLLVVWLEDPATKKQYPFPPGGTIEPGETPAEAAGRECFEESGYKTRIDPQKVIVKRYDFSWKGRIVPCETHFYFGTLLPDPPTPPTDTEYLVRVDWLARSEWKEKLSVCSAILEAVQGLA